MSKKTAENSGGAKYEARLCHVVKRADFDGYGFNLHAEKGRPGQYIGKVDDGSPAEAAGLRQGDRIIEVNGQNITNETHKKVVELIKSVPNETKLLVIDPRADANDLKAARASAAATNNNNNHNNNNGTSPTISTGAGSVTTIITTTTTTAGTTTSNGHSHDVKENGKQQQQSTSTISSTSSISSNSTSGHSNGSSPSKDSLNDTEKQKKAADVNGGSGGSAMSTVVPTVTGTNGKMMTNGESVKKQTGPNGGTAVDQIIEDTKAALTLTDGGVKAQNGTNGSNGTSDSKKLNLTMTAAELRAQLASRKKFDPKSEVCDLRKKYDIIQKM